MLIIYYGRGGFMFPFVESKGTNKKKKKQTEPSYFTIVSS